MSIWFEGTGEVESTIDQVKRALDNLGEYFVGVIALMPGLTSVELVDEGNDSVTIRTNEGLMQRTGIVKRFEPDRVVVEFNEEYVAGSKVTTTSHFFDEFISSGAGVTHRTVISNVAAPGFLGFFYRRFGSSKMGNAFLKAHATYFKSLP